MFNVQLYLEEAVLAEIEYQTFVGQSNLKVSGVVSMFSITLAHLCRH